MHVQSQATVQDHSQALVQYEAPVQVQSEAPVQAQSIAPCEVVTKKRRVEGQLKQPAKVKTAQGSFM
ncbi:hypothetical protein TSUD_368290 [Trifolium subterraneum]|uniref:Uncharacterized protein n=1 Tax=Trifolium subterraneum TaxID=3900 RepID=A0A2Z6LI77_TRISU|nr:hypothetical protein TSUD_368290 [Trifolium subterraneum]